MSTAILRGRTARGVTAIAVVGVGALAMMPGGVPVAHADPQQLTAPVVAVGSDTIQDITNALAGGTNNIDYTPLHSDLASGRLQITSWDAVPPGTSTTVCISPKAPGASFNRPNGSGSGKAALSRAIDGGNYGDATHCGAKPVSGLIDMARSSSGPAAGDTATDLTYVPIGRDGVSYAYYTTGTATAVTDLTKAELTQIYTSSGTGVDIVRGTVTTHVIPCEIQSGSGTRKFFEGAVAASATQDDTASTTCNNATSASVPAGPVEENQPRRLQQKGDAFAAAPVAPLTANNEYIIGMSAGSFIAQQNGVSPSTLSSPATTVDLGSISNDGTGVNLGKPYTGTAPSLVPSSTFYSNSTFGRNVYYVFDTGRVGAGTFGNVGLKQMFIGATSLICQTGVGSAQERVNKFGFLTPSNCGSITTTGGLSAAGTL
ncbi:MAG: hypothetical protein NVS3B21_15600 [Acidimicrobiales bacterium]